MQRSERSLFPKLRKKWVDWRLRNPAPVRGWKRFVPRPIVKWTAGSVNELKACAKDVELNDSIWLRDVHLKIKPDFSAEIYDRTGRISVNLMRNPFYRETAVNFRFGTDFDLPRSIMQRLKLELDGSLKSSVELPGVSLIITREPAAVARRRKLKPSEFSNASGDLYLSDII